MIQATADRITPTMLTEISGQKPAAEQESDDFRPYLEDERDDEAISRSGRLTRIASVAMQLRQQVNPAREVALGLAWLDPRMVAFHEFEPHTIAPYNRLAISLITGAATRSIRRVLITSAQYGEGRTSVTLNLAAELARAGQRVLVVDSDFVRPSTLRLLGVEAETGLADVIAKGLPVGRAMIRLQPAGFNLLPTRAQVENSAELLVSPYFDAVIQMLKLEYDFILFDSAPLLAAADASLLELHTDATLMVIRPGYTSTSQMAKAVASLDEKRLFGAVLNRVVT